MRARPASRRKPRGAYHHGDLRRALLDEALRTIRAEGIGGLTLRSAGQRLGVSRTALYRHFADKEALLAAVATEGFRMLREQTQEAWTRGGGGPGGLRAMAAAYVGFALANPSHYRVMFGGRLGHAAHPELQREGAGAFQVLVDAIRAQQQDGTIRADDPVSMARYIWAVVHGIAMLAIDGLLQGGDDAVMALTAYAVERLRTGIDRES